MTTTIGGVPWLEARPFGEHGPNYQQWIANVLAPLSREQGYCLCYHPFSDMIKFDGLGCGFCEQQVTEQSNGPEAKALRTQATRAAYPELWPARRIRPRGQPPRPAARRARARSGPRRCHG